MQTATDKKTQQQQENNTPNSDNSQHVVVEVPIKVPRIGIVGHMLIQNGNSIGITLPYLTYFERFGNVKIINPTAQLLEEDLDLLVLPGGPDVAATRYLNPTSNSKKKDKTSKIHWKTQRPDEQREWFDINILPQYIEKRVPIFGICRGHQTLAVHFGSELIQHLNGHAQNPDTSRESLIQSLAYYNVEVVNDLLIVTEGGKQQRIDVNSMHHQAVKTTPANATTVGYTVESYYSDKADLKKSCWMSEAKYSHSLYLPDFQEDDHRFINEALIYNDYPIASVQWHPEEIWDEFSEELIIHLLSCSNN